VVVIFLDISNIKGYIFDLDGTLIDSMPLWYNVDRIFLTEHGITPPENISEIVKKMTVEQSSKYFLDTFHLKISQQEIIDRIEEIVAQNYRDTIPLKSGILELLNYLDSKSIPYGVATATYRTLATSCLERLGLLARIKFLETCSEIGKGKEFPDIFFKCADSLGLPPESVAVVEDSLYCLETAKEHGFYTIGMYDSSSSSDWDSIQKVCDLTFKSAREFLEYINSMC
jgi:HAD superfamily hydrolase (TIGR01509 family)